MSAKQKAESERIKLNSGAAGLARLAIVFLVLLLKSLLGRSGDVRGRVVEVQNPRPGFLRWGSSSP